MTRLTMAIIVAMALVACDRSTAPEQAELTPTPEPAAHGAEAPAEPIQPEAELAGRHCFFLQDEKTTEALDVTFADGTGSGTHFGLVHDAENAYFTAFDTKLSSGEVREDGAWEFAALTHVDGDTQNNRDAWQITADSAGIWGFENHHMTPTTCDGLESRVYGDEPVD